MLLQCLPDEKSFPKDIFTHFVQLYRDCLTGQALARPTHTAAVECWVYWPHHHYSMSVSFFASAGKVIQHLSFFLVGSRFLGHQEHAGFLYVCSTLQSLQGLPLPNQPYLFGLLVHREEAAWAKAFPLRLMLRLGAEYRCKPSCSESHAASGFLFIHSLYFCLSSLPVSSVQRAIQEAPVWGNRSHHNETVSGECQGLQQLSFPTGGCL